MTFRSDGLERVRTLLESGVSDVYSGAALAIGTREVEETFIVGEREAGGEPVTADTRFDLASLTKAIATTTVTLRLVERGRIVLDAPLSAYLDPVSTTDRGAIPVRSLLTHTSGLPPYKSFPFGWDSRDALVESMYDSPLSVLAPPDELYVYSDLNFVLLGEIVRSVTNDSLATAFDERVASPLGLDRTSFGPLPENTPVAATRDRRWRKRILRGEIHDYMGAIMDGESGNAGLFATAGDVATVATMLLDRGSVAGTRVLAPTTVETLRENILPSIDERHGLGWRLGTTNRPATGWSRDAFGHTGFTGTSVWIDPRTDLFVVLLTNRLLVSDDAEPIARLRTRLHEAALAALDDPGRPVQTDTPTEDSNP